MQIKLNWSKNKATIVFQNEAPIHFLIDEIEKDKLKDYVLKYNFESKDYLLTRIKAIVDRNTVKKEKVKDYSAKIAKIKLVSELQDLKIHFDELEFFKKSNYFKVINKDVYLKDSNFILPESYLKLILNKQNENLTPYINFIYNLSENPNEHVRNNIWEWIDNKGFKITENGYIFGARWVVNEKQNNNKMLADFVNSEYVKRKLQKKAPKNYDVWTNENYGFTYYSIQKDLEKPLGNHKFLGNLNDLYLDNEIVFTDQRTGKMIIKLGVPVSIPREECDDSQTQCSKGLHFLSLKDADNVNFGNQLITVLVSPKNIASLPKDSYLKARCCEYFPYSIITKDDVNKMLADNNLVISDVDYESINLNETLKSLKEKTNLYKTNSDKIKAIKDKIKLSSKNSKPEEVVFNFNRIVTL